MIERSRGQALLWTREFQRDCGERSTTQPQCLSNWRITTWSVVHHQIIPVTSETASSVRLVSCTLLVFNGTKIHNDCPLIWICGPAIANLQFKQTDPQESHVPNMPQGGFMLKSKQLLISVQPSQGPVNGFFLYKICIETVPMMWDCLRGWLCIFISMVVTQWNCLRTDCWSKAHINGLNLRSSDHKPRTL